MWPFRRAAGPVGQRGEALAARHLGRRGCRILARNYRCPAGEVDLIALDPAGQADTPGEAIVFVEVKTRRSDEYVDPASAVTPHKQRQLARAAAYYLAHHAAGDRFVRFDVVSVVLPPSGEPRVRHIVDAFRRR